MSDIFSILEGHLKHSTLRHGVIASNIANIDTPGYQARDMARFCDELLQATLELTTTHPDHMVSPELSGPDAIGMIQQSHWGDQNNVELDLEVAKMTENAIFFQAASTLLSKNISMYKTAMRR